MGRTHILSLLFLDGLPILLGSSIVMKITPAVTFLKWRQMYLLCITATLFSSAWLVRARKFCFIHKIMFLFLFHMSRYKAGSIERYRPFRITTWSSNWEVLPLSKYYSRRFYPTRFGTFGGLLSFFVKTTIALEVRLFYSDCFLKKTLWHFRFVLQAIPDQPEPAALTLEWANELEVITLMLLRYITFDFTVYLKLIFLFCSCRPFQRNSLNFVPSWKQ